MDRDVAVEKALKAMEKTKRWDRQTAHAGVDRAVLQYLRDTGQEKIADAWEAVRDAMDGFRYA